MTPPPPRKAVRPHDAPQSSNSCLLCVAAPLVALPFAMLALNHGQALGATTLGVPAGHLRRLRHRPPGPVRKFAPGADPAILPLAFALSGTGIAFVTRLAPDVAVTVR